jgi:hypothetical protein
MTDQKVDPLHPDFVARPPRHRHTGELCVRALITGDCRENHEYDAVPMTPMEHRLVYLEVMVNEVAALYAGDDMVTFEVDEVFTEEQGSRVHSIYGTKVTWNIDEDAFRVRSQTPYIIGQV